MNNEERVKQIKSDYKYAYMIQRHGAFVPAHDFDFLVTEAEKVAQLEQIIKDMDDKVEELQSTINGLVVDLNGGW